MGRNNKDCDAIVKGLIDSRATSNKHFKFTVYVNQGIMREPLDNLNLSVRSSNCLKRAGMNTIGDLVNAIDDQDDLLKYRNLGNNSAKEIMNQLFKYQYDVLNPEAQERYIETVLAMNSK